MAISFHRTVYVVALCVAVCGCGTSGPARCEVSGRVTFDGVPLETGVIQFHPTSAEGGPAAGAEIKAGGYRTPKGKGPMKGLHRVEITAFRKGKREPSKGVEGVAGGLSGAGESTALEMYLPAKFNAKSELTFDVQPGRNSKDFELKSP